MAPPTASSPLPLFDSAFLAKLEQLYLLSKKLSRGEYRAERPSRQIGSSLEFADYRNYTAGDDLRTIDWNIYGRLDRLFIKLYEQEKDLHIHLLIDASASMRWQAEESRVEGRKSSARDGAAQPLGPSTLDLRFSTRVTKLDHARRIAASLAYIGLANLDRVDIHWFGEALADNLGLARGKSQFHAVLDFLRRAPDLSGPTRLLPSVRAFARRTRRRGLVILLSDFFDPAGFEEALSLLRHERFEAHVIQTLDPAELDPIHTGDLRLTECETGDVFEVTANEALLRSYREEMTAFLQRLDAFCRERGMVCARALTTIPFEDLVLRLLRNGVMMR